MPLHVEMKQAHLQILDYIKDNLNDDPLFDWILKESEARGIPQIQVTAAQARLMNLLTKLVGARRVVEVGTLSGYSGVWIARGMAPGGKLYTFEFKENHAQLARETFERAGVADRVVVTVGPALDGLNKLELDGPLDLMFIDADKPNNYNYFQWGLSHVRPGGLLMVDNVFTNGRVADPITDETSEYIRSIATFNQYIFDNFNDNATYIPFYKPDEDNLDGMMIVQIPEA